MDKIKVLLADDHTIVREGIKFLLQSRDHFAVVAEVSNGREAVHKTRELKPDIVIMDISMPILNGLEATRQIVEDCPGCKILVLTMHEDRETVRQILKAGAAGCLVKKSAASDLFTGIEAVYRGEAFFSPSISKMLLEDYISVSGPAEEILSPREREVLQLIVEGHTNKEIADILCISFKTVEGHKDNIKRKLGVQDQTELIKYAIQKRMITFNTV
ncbi:MAG: Oxygen regulatory protein NreC [Syntrophorhabdaceae bacterium PtaU1.Bin034]|nr:MAG: Oxygen regulatory protein NreC [Syntrophorhabdaceae bacterium PtaU1.Bin034]